MKIMESKGINIAIAMTITFSKVMALLIIVLSFLMDFLNDKGGTVFMFAIPFAVFLITGKQAIDWKKEQVKTDK
jgi:uncharacterized membrane protein (DUF485 family)